VANRNSNVFHTADCKWATTIKDENMIGFKDMTEARGHQYKPCRTCCREALVERRAESAFAGRSQSVGWR
jgi:methylphosphotriester-DNA--protein-cysteine methyltransferase